MKKWTMFVLIAFVSLLAQGCSHETSADLKEVGRDMKRDINKAARDVDDKVQDAVER